MKNERGGFRMLRREELRQEALEDSYHPYLKLPEPASCPDCGATYRQGRWTWQKAPAKALKHRCPACQRIQDDFPAGQVTLKGPFVVAHRNELVSAIRAREAHEKSDHPLERIMALEESAGGFTITTTGVHLARGIAHALHDAYQGSLSLRYNRKENHMRATWTR